MFSSTDSARCNWKPTCFAIRPWLLDVSATRAQPTELSLVFADGSRVHARSYFIQQRHNPSPKARRDPRTKYLGFTSRQWPFLYVLVGNWIFALTFFLALKFAWHWVPAEWNTPGDKIALVFQCAAFALLPAVIAICIVAAQRLNPEMWVGRTAKPNSALDINTRFILNTFRAVHDLFGSNCGRRPLLASRGSPRFADPNRTVRARADLVLDRIPQASIFARLRLWGHLLPDGCNLYLVCAAHSVRRPHTSVLISGVHHRSPRARRPVDRPPTAETCAHHR
jgi:hypothetical protein